MLWPLIVKWVVVGGMSQGRLASVAPVVKSGALQWRMVDEQTHSCSSQASRLGVQAPTTCT